MNHNLLFLEKGVSTSKKKQTYVKVTVVMKLATVKTKQGVAKT